MIASLEGDDKGRVSSRIGDCVFELVGCLLSGLEGGVGVRGGGYRPVRYTLVRVFCVCRHWCMGETIVGLFFCVFRCCVLRCCGVVCFSVLLCCTLLQCVALRCVALVLG